MRTILVLIGSAIFFFGSAQTQIGRDEEEDRTLDDPARSAGSVPFQGIALESTIDPAKYYVGPSDVYSISVSIDPPGILLLNVTPEGTLIIPTVGEVHVADLTLDVAKKKVISLIKSKYTGVEASMTLVFPRPVVVIVSGNVLNPGSYTLASYFRADKAVELANKPNPLQTVGDIRRNQQRMSTRNIAVRHKDGTLGRVDIDKYLATREDEWNPYLREGDIIVVPRNDLTKGGIGIYGEVNSPGRYEFVDGDSLRDALLIANGFTRRAIRDSVEFSRVSLTGEEMTSSIVDADAILQDHSLDFPLHPGDRIVVRAVPDLRGDDIVEIEGEVRYPGTYPITKNKTKLSEILRKAGGLTEYASINNAELFRKSVQETEIDLERLESARGGVTPDDSAYYYLETDLRIMKEVVNVNFERLIVGQDSTQDVILKDEDVIRIPPIKRTIYVFGQVVTTGHVQFVNGLGVDYYIEKAGGITERARADDIKIVKAKTKQWLSPDETTIEEGDYVWVPKDYERPFGYYLAIVGQTAAIVSVALSVVILALQISK